MITEHGKNIDLIPNSFVSCILVTSCICKLLYQVCQSCYEIGTRQLGYSKSCIHVDCNNMINLEVCIVNALCSVLLLSVKKVYNCLCKMGSSGKKIAQDAYFQATDTVMHVGSN